MLADITQHQRFVRLSTVVPADITLLSNRIYFVLWLSNRIYFVLWFSIGSSCQADNYKFQQSSKPSTLAAVGGKP
jgi:hypothetical protein